MQGGPTKLWCSHTSESHFLYDMWGAVVATTTDRVHFGAIHYGMSCCNNGSRSEGRNPVLPGSVAVHARGSSQPERRLSVLKSGVQGLVAAALAVC